MQFYKKKERKEIPVLNVSTSVYKLLKKLYITVFLWIIFFWISSFYLTGSKLHSDRAVVFWVTCENVKPLNPKFLLTTIRLVRPTLCLFSQKLGSGDAISSQDGDYQEAKKLTLIWDNINQYSLHSFAYLLYTVIMSNQEQPG